MKWQTIRDIDVQGKRVLVRVTLNVPIKDGVVGDQTRIHAALPTLQYLLARRASLILLSHHSTEGTSLAPVAPILAGLLGHPVRFMADALSDETKAAAAALQPGEVLLLENLRFHPEEEANDPGFAKALADLGDIYVDADFTAMHRAHASIVGIPQYLPSVGGLLVEREVDTITAAMEQPKRPLLVVTGGAKISTKIPILLAMIGKADAVLIGGAMANTFLAADGQPVGKSLYEADQVTAANDIVAKAKERGVQLFLPIDVVVSKSATEAVDQLTVLISEVGPDDIIVDLGPQTIEQIRPVLGQQGTVIWNGPIGITEVPAFAAGTRTLADAIIASGATSLVGGGDTIAFVDQAGLADKFSFVSTGGGASLELMSGHDLPGLTALRLKDATSPSS